MGFLLRGNLLRAQSLSSKCLPFRRPTKNGGGGRVDEVIVDSCSAGRSRPTRSRRKRTLLSFQRPRHLLAAKKSLRLAPEASRLATQSYPSASEGAPVVEVQGLCLTACRSGSGSIATPPGVSNRGFPHRYAVSATRAKRRFPAWTTLPARSSRGTSSSVAVVPLSLTPPWATRRRASLVEPTSPQSRS